MKYESSDVGRINRAIKFALDVHWRRNRPLDYQFKPSQAADLLTSLDCPIEVVIAAICADVLKDTVMTPDDLREKLGDDVIEVLLEFTTKETKSWVDRQRHKLIQMETWSLKACVVVAARTLINLEFTRSRLEHIDDELVNETRENFMDTFGTSEDNLQAYFTLLTDLLNKKAKSLVKIPDTLSNSQLLEVFDALSESAGYVIFDIWPSKSMSVIQAQEILNFYPTQFELQF